MFARFLTSIATVILTMVLGVKYIVEPYFFGSQRDAVAVVVLAVGLVMAVVVWRATRRWKPRAISASEMASGFDVYLSPNYLAFAALLSVPTLGIAAIYFWIIARPMPRKLDPEGMTLRNGKRFAWRDVNGIKETQVRIGGQAAGKRWNLTAGKVEALISPPALKEGRAVVAFASQRLGGALT